MKPTITLVLLLVVDVISLWAQPTSITLLTFESYTFADQFDTQYGSAKVLDGFQWGAGLEFGLSDENAIELIYQHLDTDAYYQGVNRRYDGSIGVNYILVGGTRYMPVNEKISGFGTLDLGLVGSIPARPWSRKAQQNFQLEADWAYELPLLKK